MNVPYKHCSIINKGLEPLGHCFRWEDLESVPPTSLAADEEFRGFSDRPVPQWDPSPGHCHFISSLCWRTGAPRTASSHQALVGWIFHVLLQLVRPQRATLIIVVEMHCNYTDQAPDTCVHSPHGPAHTSRRFDFIYDLFEHVSSRNNQDTLKCGSKHRRPTVSSQFKVSLHHWLAWICCFCDPKNWGRNGVYERCGETGPGFCSVTFLRQAELHRYTFWAWGCTCFFFVLLIMLKDLGSISNTQKKKGPKKGIHMNI